MRRLAILALVLGTPAQGWAGARGPFCEVLPCLPGPITRRTLARDEVIAGIACRRGHEVGVDAAGRLAFCTTARAQRLDGMPVAARAYTLVHPNGRVYQTHLARRHDLTLATGAVVACGPDTIARTADGALRYCTLAAKRAWGVPARVGDGIAFHPSGWIAGATLAVPMRVHGVDLPAGTSVSWDAAGRAVGAHVEYGREVTLGGLRVGGPIVWSPAGVPQAVTLAAPVRRAGHELPARAELTLRPDGTIASATYVERMGTMPHGELVTDTRRITFDQAGAIASSWLDTYQSDVRPPSRVR